jgi:chromosomal replication initiation ATPase DnaA
MLNFVPCEKCKDSKKPGFLLKKVRGYFGSGADKYIECDCHKQWVNDIGIEKRLKDSELPNLNYSLNSYLGTKSLNEIDVLKRYAQEWPNQEHLRKAFIYIYGNNGCQKTCFISLIGKEICKYSSVKFLPIKKLYDILRDSYIKDEAKEKLEKLQSFDLLILDEVMDPQKINSTDWTVPLFDSFIRERIDYLQKGTILISNIAPQDIDAKKFGTSLKDLIIRKSIGKVFEFKDNYIDNIDRNVSVAYDSNLGLFPKRKE